MEVDGTFEALTKKEVAHLVKEKGRLEKNLGGIKEMKELPGVVFIIDTRKEAIAVAEAKRMGIPIVAVVDTNCNPEGIDYPVPGNDDAIRAINLFTQIIANAVVEADNEVGLEVIENLQDEQKEEDLSSAVDPGEVSDKDETEDEVEKAPLGDSIGEAVAEEEKSRFADKDYSDYDPADKAEATVTTKEIEAEKTEETLAEKTEETLAETVEEAIEEEMEKGK